MTPVVPMTSEGAIYGPRWREGPNRPMQRRAKWSFREAPIKIEKKENNLTGLETRKSIVSDFPSFFSHRNPNLGGKQKYRTLPGAFQSVHKKHKNDTVLKLN
ncbi:hypothetical protein TorRG33x02_232410 [Trema orientale]|uniref:Uncharacterized protein n=1 Tax=Trema orientale TaxID=63057 RepID=A0A2P5E643_TREOI|nr:hypothetical protein TorRG33x02_232410 [Trema orientale]